MRKTLVYLLILGILGLGVWFFLFRDNSTFGEAEAGFTIADTSSVGAIFLANQKGASISLKRNDTAWTLNDKYVASTRMVSVLLETMHEQYAAHPVPEASHNTVVASMAGSAIKVEVYDKKGKMLKRFYVGGQVGDRKGTYMLMDGADKPYVVKIPAYEGYITPRYSVDITDWRNRTVVDIPASRLATVTVKYAGEEEQLNNFKLIKNSANKFDIEINPELKSSISTPLNDRRVKSFTGFFEGVGCEGYLEGVTKLDSIIASVPKYCDISVRDVSGKGNDIAIYRMRVNKRSKNVTEDYIPEFDGDRYYGIINNSKDTVILQHGTFEKMFRKGYEFYQPDTEQ